MVLDGLRPVSTCSDMFVPPDGDEPHALQNIKMFVELIAPALILTGVEEKQPKRWSFHVSTPELYYASADCRSTGFISTTGVPSMASIGPTFNLFTVISKTATRCRPSGFGLSADRVEKTPAIGLLFSLRGCTFNMSR